MYAGLEFRRVGEEWSETIQLFVCRRRCAGITHDGSVCSERIVRFTGCCMLVEVFS
jgi:hypothetical protein